MDNNIAVYSLTALQGTNKAGLLSPDQDGYRTVVIGSLNAYNSWGAFYELEPARKFFDQSSSFQRRIANGALYGELGHPRRMPNMSTEDFINRILDVDEKNICCHFRKVWLAPGTTPDEEGRPVTVIMAEVKPWGPHAAVLEQAFQNKSQNVCFSIRSLTEDRIVGGTTIKALRTIVCFDFVLEPGMSLAKKWHSPALEALSDSLQQTYRFSEELLRQNCEQQESLGLESATMARQVIEDFGWSVRSSFGPRPVSQTW